MSRRFSSQLLYNLRNHIPITRLIEDVLGMPTRRVDGYFRFACPNCNGFHTGVKPERNLARCFDCRKNFNPIDMVMSRQKIDFTQSVYFLEKLIPPQQLTGRIGKQGLSPGSNHEGRCASDEKTSVYSVGQILSQLTTYNKDKSLPDANPVYIRDIIRRIEILEQKLAVLLQHLSRD